MSYIAIVGAHSKVARILGSILVDRGDTVTGIVRGEDQFGDLAEVGVAPRLLDLEAASDEDYANALKGHDAVVFCAGAGGGDIARTYAIDRDASIRTCDAAVAAGVPRYVLISTIGSGHPERLDSESDYLIAKGAADDHVVAQDDLEWTIIRPGYLSNDDATGRISLGSSPDQWDGPSIPRSDVARVLAAVLTHGNSAKKIITVFGGDVDIDAAISSI